MLWPGTLLGAGAGFFIASIPGAMLGALLGHALDRRLSLLSWAHLRERLGGRAALRNDELLFVLLGRLAKSDGRVVRPHIDQALQEMRQLAMTVSAQQRAIAAFNRGKSGNDSLRGYLHPLRARPDAVEGVLRACWRMILADGRVGPKERELVVQWGHWLGWSSQRVLALGGESGATQRRPATRGGSYQASMALLGVSASSDPVQIKRAYRRLLSRHHPDKVAGNGASPAQVREATEKTRELHQAYVIIREYRGF